MAMPASSKLCLLSAYPYLNKCSAKVLNGVVARRGEIEFFLDSGAYTAWTKGEVISIPQYRAFIESLPFTPDRMMTLDVIGDAEGTRRNFDLMLGLGLDIVPIITRGEDPSALEYYYQHSDLVGLGGVARVDSASAAWCQAMMSHVGDRKAHILGMTRFDWVKLLRPWSVDSSTWLSGARFGECHVYLGNGHLTKFEPRRGKPPKRLAERIRRLGFDPYELGRAYAGVGNNSLWQQITACSWIEYSIEQQRNIGTRLFLAFSTEVFFHQLVACYDRVMAVRQARGLN